MKTNQIIVILQVLCVILMLVSISLKNDIVYFLTLGIILFTVGFTFYYKYKEKHPEKIIKKEKISKKKD